MDQANGRYKWGKHGAGERRGRAEGDAILGLLLLRNIPAPSANDLEPLTDNTGTVRNATSFWSTPHPADHPVACRYHYTFSPNDDYAVKYDPHTGELLFIDVANQSILGYFLDEGFGDGGNGRHYSDPGHTSALQLDQALLALQKMYGLGGPHNLSLGNNLSIALNPAKKNALMGAFWDGAAPSNTSNALSNTRYLASTDFDGRTGGYQLLNVPNRMYATSVDFWDEYNEPWINTLALDAAVEFIVLTDPMNPSLLFRNGQASGFNRELTTLLTGNYNLDLQFDQANGMYKWVKHSPGANVDQTEEEELRALLSQ